jgi:hypothetical protein
MTGPALCVLMAGEDVRGAAALNEIGKSADDNPVTYPKTKIVTVRCGKFHTKPVGRRAADTVLK